MSDKVVKKIVKNPSSTVTTNTILIRHYCFSGHLNRRNNDFLILCEAYVYAVPLLLRTINVLKMNVGF